MNSREAQFQKFFEAHADEIFRFIYFRLYDRETAKELVQEAFLRVWQIELKEIIWNKRALLFKVARNLIVDYLRRRKETLSLDEIQEKSGEEPATQIEMEDMVETKIFLARLSKLEKTEQELIDLRYLQGFSPREIGKILGRSSGVVSVQLSRAKKKLKQLYENSTSEN